MGFSGFFGVLFCCRGVLGPRGSGGPQGFSKISKFRSSNQQVLNPTPLNPTPATCHKRKTEVALQFSESCAAETALQHSLFCSAEVIFTKSCAATSEKMHSNIEKAALQESGAFLPLSCGFQGPTFRLPPLGPADQSSKLQIANC